MNLRRFFRRRRHDEDLAREIAAHMEAERAEYIARGASPEEADRRARIKFGSERRVHEDLWQQNSLVPLENMARDLRYGLRTLRRARGFSIAAILTIAVGIGATSLVFSILYGAVLNPYPYRDAGRIVQMGFIGKQGIRGFMGVNLHDLETVRHASTVEDAMLTDFADPITDISGFPEDVEAARFSGNAFDFLGVPPLLGRTLTPADQDRQIVVLGYNFCRAHFTCDVRVLGRTLHLNRQPYTIIGVMPPRFAWEQAAVFIPLLPSADQDAVSPLYIRVRKGVRPDALAAQMLALVRRLVLASEGVELPPDTRLLPIALGQRRGMSLQKNLELLFAAVCVLLLIACANVSILLLGRAHARRPEFAVRNALGASRLRLARQVLTESLLIAFSGGILGVVLAYAGIALLRAPLVKSFFPQEAVLSVNRYVLAFSTALSIATGLLFGLLPSLRVSRNLQSSGLRVQSMAGSRAGRRSLRILIGCQIACTFLLLATAGAAIRSFIDLYKLSLGYDPHRVLTFRLPISTGEFSSWTARLQYQIALRHHLQQIPGVQQATVDQAMPTGGGMQMEYGLPADHYGPDMDVKMPRADIEFVDAHFLSAMHIPVIAGRAFTEDEFQSAESVALINRTFAHSLFGAQDPIGRTLRIPPLIVGYPGAARPAHPREIVRIIGITGDVRAAWLPGAPPRETIYLPESLFLTGTDLRVHLRTVENPLSILDMARHAVTAVNPRQPIAQVRTLDDILSQDLRSRDRWLAILFASFSGIALFLAAIGLYSIVSFAMAQRTTEFGLRIALGAQRREILRIALIKEAGVIFAGLVSGIVLSLLLTKLLRSFVGAPAPDIWLFLTCSGIMLTTSAIASLIPAQRAAHLDPAQVLRTE
jgi:predicted permease